MAEFAKGGVVRNREPTMPKNDAFYTSTEQPSDISLLSTLRQRAVQIENDMTIKFRSELHAMLNELLDDAQHSAVRSTGGSLKHSNKTDEDVPSASMIQSNRQKTSGMPHRKVFQLRNSLLSDIMEISHMRTVRAIFVAICILATITSLLSGTILHESIILDLQLVVWSFGRFSVALLVWLAIQISVVFFLFLPFFVWSTRRTGGRLRANLFDYLMLAYYLCYFGALAYFPTRFLLNQSFPPATALFLASEQVRMLMKIYSFVREKAAETFSSDTGNIKPEFSNFIYFTFVPTLLYRDAYPRTPGPIKWQQVVYHFAGFLFTLMCVAHILQHFAAPTFSSINYGAGVTWREFVQLVASSSIPTIAIKFGVFYGLLHAWQNMFAELFRFGDREFYRDWWNSTSYSSYYRTWNIVVHEWLHQYVYRDLTLLFGRRKLQPVYQMATLLLSAVMHEYFVTLTFNSFFPIMFVLFAGCGVIMFFLHSGTGNQYFASITIWMSLFLGYGLLMCFYGMEWFARRQCPSIFASENEKWKDFYVPRSLTCSWNTSTDAKDLKPIGTVNVTPMGEQLTGSN